jgi:hydrogenase maturation protease
MNGNRRSLLILGLGNSLCSDDGLGVAAVGRLLNEWDVPADASVLDGGTLGLSLLPYLQDAQDVILLDAIRTEAPAGTFVRIHGDDVAPAVATRLSVHQIGVADLLDGARWLDSYPRRLTLLGLVPATMELGLELSTPLQQGLEGLLEETVAEAASLGYVFRRRTTRPLGPDSAGADRPEHLWLSAARARARPAC